MPKLDQIHQFLRAKADPCIDQAIAQAMPTADEATLGRLAMVLLQRKHTLGRVSLIEEYHRLPEPARQAVLEDAPELTRALRQAMANHPSQGPANALDIIRHADSVRLAYLIPDLIRQGDDTLKDQAAHCLLEMAARAGGWDADPAGGGGDPVQAGFVVSAVREALRFYAKHRRNDVLLAMFALPLPAVTQLLEMLGSMGDDWTHPTGRMLARSQAPSVRAALIPSLAYPALQRFAVEAIGLAQETGELHLAVRHWHLLYLKQVRDPLSRLKQIERLVPGKSSFAVKGGPGSTAGLVHWLSALPGETHVLIRRLGALCKMHDPATRLAALSHLITLSADTGREAQVHQAIAGFANDPEPAIVRITVTHLIRVQFPDITKVLTQLINSPDPSIQRIAAKRLVPVAFTKLWESWPRLDVSSRLAAGRALIKIDPTFHNALHEKLCLPDIHAKTQALSIISELNQGLLLQETILRLAQDPDLRVAASAIKALGSADPAKALPTVEAALDHEDDRVRANAVEALAQLDTGRHAETLVGLTDETEPNRARANAIHGLMQMNAGQALTALSRMLGDPRSEHRISALWLVEALGIAEVARDVAEMSITERDPDVRGRAERVIRDLIDHMSRPVQIQSLLGKTSTPESGKPGRAAG